MNKLYSQHTALNNSLRAVFYTVQVQTSFTQRSNEKSAIIGAFFCVPPREFELFESISN